MSIDTTPTGPNADELPRWSVADVHESFEARSFVDAMERCAADTTRLEALFDELGIRAIAPRPVTADDGRAADAVITAINALQKHGDITQATIYASLTTDTADEKASGLMGEFEMTSSRVLPLTARLAEWVKALGVDPLAVVSEQVAVHHGPLSKLAARAEHQMSEVEEGLYAELMNSASSAWDQLHGVVTSQLTALVPMPDGTSPELPMSAVRGLASHADPVVRKAAYDAEMEAWPKVTAVCAAAMNGVKGEANTVNRRRGWASPLEASLFANSVGRATFDAMQQAITDSLPDFRGWMRAKATLHGHDGALPWYDMFAPLPFAPAEVSWDEGLGIVRRAFASYGGSLAGLLDRAIDGRWIDAAPRPGKVGGAFCMPFVDDRSLVLLNWSGSVDSAQVTAHELGHAYHNTQLAQRTPMQKDLPMALAETASIFCETLVVEEGLQRLEGRDRLALLDVDLQGSCQVVVDIRSRFLFETEVFARRQRRTLGATEMNEMMLAAQQEAYGDGLLQSTAHPYMWALKGHYYGAHFYNWPYTYGMLFGLGLFAQYRQDPERFSAHYDDALSRAGMDTAEALGAVFGFDITDVAFWTASLDIVRGRIRAYDELAAAQRVTTLYTPTRDELADLLQGEPRYRLDQVWSGLYTQLAEPGEITNVPKALRERLATALPTALTPVVRKVSDAGDTVKYLWELAGGSRIETVLMVYPDRVTVCVSSQAGCAMACGFCATGQAGFTRHLTAGEIVEQVVRAARDARAMGRRLANVVYMGMGEPMANEAAVRSSVERLHDAVGLSARHLTISTVGLVRAIARADARSYQVKWPGAEWVEADVLKPETLDRAMAGVDTAYYLIHSLMLSARQFEEADLQAAINFRLAAEKQKVKRIIYLGGLGDMRTPMSPHLHSRTMVAHELAKGPALLTTLRAAIIIGSGSASYEIIAGLVKNLRLIPLPRWTRTRCQPIGIRDVIKYLVGVLEIRETAGQSFDIGGPDILTYAQMLKVQKNLVGKKIFFFPVLYSNTAFYAYMASLVISVPAPIIRNLITSIHHEVICQNSEIKKVLPFPTIPYKEALLRALSREEQDKIHTRWSDAYPSAFELAIKLQQLSEPPQFSKYYAIASHKEAEALFKSVCQIGGKKGWFHSNFLWRMRGLLDRLLMGIGTARGRRSNTSLQVNDVIDFWRVEDMVPDQKLLLRAEMKLPGKAWLEFAIADRGESRLLSVKAYFYTRTLLGKIYWHFFLPFHIFIFRDLILGIEARSRPT